MFLIGFLRLVGVGTISSFTLTFSCECIITLEGCFLLCSVPLLKLPPQLRQFVCFSAPVNHCHVCLILQPILWATCGCGANVVDTHGLLVILHRVSRPHTGMTSKGWGVRGGALAFIFAQKLITWWFILKGDPDLCWQYIPRNLF